MAKPYRTEVDGHVVEAIPMEVDQRRAYHGAPEPAVKSQHEIRIDGEIVGYAIYPTGFARSNGGWKAYSLRPAKCEAYTYRSTWDYSEFRFWSEPDGEVIDGVKTWDGWGPGRCQHLKALKPLRDAEHGWEHDDHRWSGREEIARAFVAFVAEGRAPVGRAGVDAFIEGVRKERKRRKEEDEADDARRAVERAEFDAQRARKAQEAEDHRLEIVEGLNSILERFGAQHSNFEQSALAAAIEHFNRKPKA